MENSQFRVLGAIGDNSLVWVDHETFDIIFTIMGECDVDYAFIEVCSSLNW